MKHCHWCGGAILTQGAWGYAGPICGCPRPPQNWDTFPIQTQPPITYEDIKRAVREVLNEERK